MPTATDAPPGWLLLARVRRADRPRQHTRHDAHRLQSMVRHPHPLTLTVWTEGRAHILRIYAAVSRLHRRMLHMHLSHGRRKSRVLNSLAMLVESGTIYCLLLVRPDAVRRTCAREAYVHDARRSGARATVVRPARRIRRQAQLRARRHARRAPERLPSYHRALHIRVLHPRHRKCACYGLPT